MIIIAEENTVYEQFPTPLINRMEKHQVVMETVLQPWLKSVLKLFKSWIEEFTTFAGIAKTR